MHPVRCARFKHFGGGRGVRHQVVIAPSHTVNLDGVVVDYWVLRLQLSAARALSGCTVWRLAPALVQHGLELFGVLKVLANRWRCIGTTTNKARPHRSVEGGLAERLRYEEETPSSSGLRRT